MKYWRAGKRKRERGWENKEVRKIRVKGIDFGMVANIKVRDRKQM